MNEVLDKLADFFINLAVAAIAIALFQGDLDKTLPGIAALLFAIVLALLKRVGK